MSKVMFLIPRFPLVGPVINIDVIELALLNVAVSPFVVELIAPGNVFFPFVQFVELAAFSQLLLLGAASHVPSAAYEEGVDTKNPPTEKLRASAAARQLTLRRTCW